MKVRLRNKVGQVKECKMGFSWTNLFFGWLTPLFRGDYKNFAIQLVVQIITCFISVLIFPFFYNKQYVNGLLSNGFYPADERSKTILTNAGILLMEESEF